MPPAWTTVFERDASALVSRVATDRSLDAWRALMVALAPHLEGWARHHRLLVRCRLANDDDARAVMVAVLERLAARDYENLRQFAARAPLALPVPAADDLVARVVRLGKLDRDDDETLDEGGRETPLRAWLLVLVDFTARDHVRKRLGWASDGTANKRAVHSDAVRLDEAPEPQAPAAMTDRLTVAQLVDEIAAYVAGFPADMRTALERWLDDVPLADIARELRLPDAAAARGVIRAGQARLRERFRGRSPVLFG